MAEISFDEQATTTAKQLVASYDRLQSAVQGLDVADYGGPHDELAQPMTQSLINLRNTLVRFTRKLEDALAGTAEDVKSAITTMQDYDESLVSNLQQLAARSEEHTSELQSPEAISYAVFCEMRSRSSFISVNDCVHLR